MWKMNNYYDLTKFVNSNTTLLFESYVLNYLKALARQPIYGGTHPLNVQLHIIPSEAPVLLRDPQEIQKLESILNCDRKEVFERLRDLIDKWDGVHVPQSFEDTDLVEADSGTLLLNSDAHQIASRYLKCAPEDVLGTLFDSIQMYSDLISVSGRIHFADNDVYKLLSYLSSAPELKQKVKVNFDFRDWWEVLENWVKPSIQSELAVTLSQQTGESVSKAYVLRELFRLVKIAMGIGISHNKPYPEYIQSTQMGKILPKDPTLFWQTLKEFSVDDSNNFKLDRLEENNIARNSTEANAKEALRLAENYMQTYVHPLQHELGKVDMFGMIALKYRFQGIVDELLSNALHYALLDSDVQNPLSYIQDAIRYYCHGEYKIALGNFLNVPFLSLEQLGLEFQITNQNLDVENETPIVMFSAEDNTFMGLNLLMSGNRPSRNISRDELLIALQLENRSIEILSISKLEKTQIDQIKSAFPKTVAGLIDNGYSLAERIIKTPFPVSAERQKTNASIKDNIVPLVRALVLTGTSFSLGHLISAKDVFKKIPRPLNSEKTLRQTYSLNKLGDEIVAAYQVEGIHVTRISGA